MKKILLLGGSAQQVIAIETAKKLGYYTVLCDYLPDNPGQYVADRFYQESTTDKEAILKIAREENIDGILAYASDPAAPTAAFVAEKLDLPGNPYESVEMLCNKDLFRQFLMRHGFCTPKANSYSSADLAAKDCLNGKYSFPVMIKPVDSSGSKGVVRLDKTEGLYEKIEHSLTFSRVGKIIVEEYIDAAGYQVAGDCLSIDGKLVFRCFADDHFNTKCENPFVPFAASFPCSQSEEMQEKIHKEIQRLITLLGMRTCTYNFDVRIDSSGDVYLMEVAPRDGGNYIPQVIQYLTGLDLVTCSVKAAMGEMIAFNEKRNQDGYWSYYAVHSLESGILKKLWVDPNIRERHIVEDHLIKKSGDHISAFTGANETLGCFVMKFDSMEEMLNMIDHSENWIQIEVESEAVI